MTAKQMSAMIGKHVVVLWGNGGEIQFECVVTDVRWWSAADKTEYWLEPVSGGGRSWVDADLCNPVVPTKPVVVSENLLNDPAFAAPRGWDKIEGGAS